MENASKALIIAGGVLVALMIIGALILMFNNLSNYQNSEIQSTREAQITDFNKQYEVYNKKDIRGSDLYSILNKAIDYNQRKTEEGYEAIEITFSITGNLWEQIPYSTKGDRKLFKKNNYTTIISNSENAFKKNIFDEITKIENKYTENSMRNIVKDIVKILENDDSAEAIKLYNMYCPTNKVSNQNDLKNRANDIYKYYEYIQFKRVHFKCTDTKYNNQTGRIIKMNFESTGTIE